MPYPIRSHCIHGHERTPENTRIVTRVVDGRVMSARQCKQCCRGTVRKWEKRNPLLVKQYDRAKNLRRKYGLTTEEWDQMLNEQNNCCACCGDSDPGAHGQWHVDHDHANGKVRSLLCFKCNIALGVVTDDVEHLELLITYLKRFQS